MLKSIHTFYTIFSFFTVLANFIFCSQAHAHLHDFTTTKYKIRKVVIDAGHGGKDPGALGKATKEKDITLAVALELGATIKKYMPEIEVIYTRTTDTFIELFKRAEIANQSQADLFISIHCNSIAGTPTVKKRFEGLEVYVMGTHVTQENLEVAKRENAVILLEDGYKKNYGGFDPNSAQAYIMLSSYQNAFLENSLRLAYFIEKEFKERVHRKSRGVKQAGFVVLRQVIMPSVLVEIGFLSNDLEEQYLKDTTNQTYVASAIFRAFRSYKEEIEK